MKWTKIFSVENPKFFSCGQLIADRIAVTIPGMTEGCGYGEEQFLA